MVEAKRSYRAMLMSMIIPGLGQIYLRKLFKGVIIFIGIILAVVLIYANSLPVTSWRDLTRIDRTETLSDDGGATGQMEAYPETDDPTLEGKDPKQWRGYTLYTSDSKFMFRITADLEQPSNRQQGTLDGMGAGISEA